jgi:serine/threonine protein kinase
MLFGHCPFQSNSIAKLIEVLNTKELEFPEKISIFLKDLIQRMLTKDPTKRVGWMEMFQIKISNEGFIESEKIKAISSLNDAKFSD